MLHMLRLAAAVVMLSGLDVAGAVLLKEAQLRKEPLLALAGVGAFVAVAVLLYAVLDLADLTLVSLGWIISYQVAVMGVDVWRYGNRPGRVQLAAIIVALVAIAVAAAAPSSQPPGKHAAGMVIPHQRWPSLEEQLRERLRQRGPLMASD